MPRGFLWFIFNLRIKNGVSYTHILMTFMIVTYEHKVCLFTLITLYTLEQLSVVSTTANESILASLSKQTESFHSPRGIGRPTTSHRWLGLAILSLACPDLAAHRRLNSNTYVNHIEMHHG
jgi:hypothetical protein